MSFVITPLSIYLDESHFPKQDVSSKSFHYNIEDGSYTMVHLHHTYKQRTQLKRSYCKNHPLSFLIK
jgi:hypothetical protein